MAEDRVDGRHRRTFTGDTPHAANQHGGRWRRFFLIGLAVLLLAVYFLPAIVVNSPMRQWALDVVNEKLAGELRCGRISAGWFSTISVENVKVLDEQQETVVEIERLSTSNSLLQLLNDSNDAGRITLLRPQVHVDVRNGGSNIEDLIAPLMQERSDDPSQLQLEVEVVDGEAELFDDAGGPLGVVKKLAGQVVFDAAKNVLSWKATAALHSNAESAGSVSCDGQATLGDAPEGNIKWQTSALPLQTLRAASLRFDPHVEIFGSLDSAGEVRWDADGCLAQLNRLDAQHIDLSGLQLLAGDRLRTDRLSGSGNLYVGSDIRCRELKLTADWAELTLTCDMQIAEMQKAVADQAWSELIAAAQGEAHGWVDVAKLSQTLPNAVQLRPNTTIEEGGLAFHLVNLQANKIAPEANPPSRPAPGRRLDVQIDTNPIVALTAGQRVEWKDPISVRASATIDEKGWTIDKMHCRSDFLTITGAGPPQAGEITIKGDLAKLHSRLKQFIDLRGVELEGELQGRGSWRQRAGSLDLGGELTASGFALIWQDNRWREPLVSVSAAISLRRDGQRKWLVDDWRGQFEMGKELLAVRPESNGCLVHLAGDAQRWYAVAHSIGKGPESLRGLEGRIDGQAFLVAAEESVEIESSTLELKDVRFRSADRTIDINEPTVSAKIAGRFRYDPPEWTTREADIRSASLAVATNHCRLQFTPQIQVDAAFSLRGDLQRIVDWLPADSTRFALTGAVVGRGEVVSQAASPGAMSPLAVAWDLSAERFTASRPPSTQSTISPVSQRSSEIVWQEPNLRTQGKVVVDLALQTIQVEKFECNSDWLAVATQGQLAFDANASVDVKGAMTYDWPTTLKRLNLTQDGRIQIIGQQSQTFAIRGPLKSANASDRSVALAPEALLASAAIGWDRASAFGFHVGEVSLNGNLRRGVIDFETVKTKVNDGLATFNPQIDLRSPQPILSLHQGDGVREIDLTPEMCHGWLKFVAPMVADATRAQGRLSLEIGAAQVPLNEFEKLQSSGELVVHEAQVGPGSLTSGLLGPLQQILAIVDPDTASSIARPTWMRIPAQKVFFQVERGRVHHKNLLLQIRDVQIRTSGSVGFDQSLDLVAEIPVLDRWIAKSRYLQSLKGKSIPLRVRGVFGDPNVDESVLRHLAKESAKGAAQELIQDQLERGLKKLFR